jgi:para-nitrobenzyl esterase
MYDPSKGLIGNYGFYDQLEALKWVNRNIEYFDGDKNKVTIIGQSAGATSVFLIFYLQVI